MLGWSMVVGWGLPVYVLGGQLPLGHVPSPETHEDGVGQEWHGRTLEVNYSTRPSH